MLTLGIETSGRQASIALCRDGICLEERQLSPEGRRHAQTLIAELRDLFRKIDSRPSDCNIVAVSVGPGSFTGLRIGVVCAKTLAYATGCQLAAVDTFQCLAENSPVDIGDVHVIADAQRGDLYRGHYVRGSQGGFFGQTEISIVAGDAWCRERAGTDVVSGPGVERYADQLSGRCRLLEEEYRQPTATVVARLGEELVNSGHESDLWTLEPFYLRKSAAEEKLDLKTGDET